MLPNPNMFYISKPEKFFFSLAIIIHFIFFGILAISLYFSLPNSIISGLLRSTCSLIAIVLFLKSLANGEFKNATLIIPFFLYIGYCNLLIFLMKPGVAVDYNSAMYGKSYLIYLFSSYGQTPFLLFLLPARRFLYLANNPWMLFWPALFSTVVMALLFRGVIFGSESLDFAESMGINRSTMKYQVAVLFFMSLYYIVFQKKSYKILFGLGGMAVAVVMIVKSSSQSLLLSTALVILVALVYSFKSARTSTTMIGFSMLGAAVALPYIFMSTAFDRLKKLLDLKLYYTYGDSGYDTSRLELIKDGWETFKSSPILGGNLYLPSGGYTHFFPMDTMMTCGVFGILLLILIFYVVFKTFVQSFSKLPLAYIWVLFLITYEFSQSFLHGNFMGALGIGVSMSLTLYMLYQEYPRGLPDLSGNEPMQRPMPPGMGY